MAKMTLLEMTQSILSAMDDDDVNSIDDTVESLQVATTIKEAYYEILSDRDWPFLNSLTTLTGLADLSNPTKMLIPENQNKIFWIKYNKKPITYLPPQEFKAILDGRTAQAGVVDAAGYILTRDPIYWTSYDDVYVHFDAYDSVVESSLVSAKTVVYGATSPAWTHEDTFVPSLPEKMFPTLLAEAKSTCFLNIKQQANPKEEKKARRGRVRFQREAQKADDGETRSNTGVNYGRK